jgi:hypothetical protein
MDVCNGIQMLGIWAIQICLEAKDWPQGLVVFGYLQNAFHLQPGLGRDHAPEQLADMTFGYRFNQSLHGLMLPWRVARSRAAMRLCPNRCGATVQMWQIQTAMVSLR